MILKPKRTVYTRRWPPEVRRPAMGEKRITVLGTFPTGGKALTIPGDLETAAAVLLEEGFKEAEAERLQATIGDTGQAPQKPRPVRDWLWCDGNDE
jgi:hypothetical protein